MREVKRMRICVDRQENPHAVRKTGERGERQRETGVKDREGARRKSGG